MSSSPHPHIAKLSNRGQITIPRELRRHLSLHKGDSVRLFRVGERLIMESVSAPSSKLAKELQDWEGLAEASLAEVWDNPEDEAWAAELVAGAEPV